MDVLWTRSAHGRTQTTSLSPRTAGVVLFTLLLGGTIGLVQKAGGGLALAKMLHRFMTGAKSALMSCMALCSLIFFDDYCAP